MSRSSRYSVVLSTLVALLSLVLAASLSYAEWTLPIADGGGVTPSPPSVQGSITAVTANSLTLATEQPSGKPTSTVVIQLTPKTQFFTGYGGYYQSSELCAGQYVWVWYITEDPKKAGTPPQAAVVMLWSTDPNDKPTPDVKWHWQKQE